MEKFEMQKSGILCFSTTNTELYILLALYGQNSFKPTLRRHSNKTRMFRPKVESGKFDSAS
jgi:hypothetical protein